MSLDAQSKVFKYRLFLHRDILNFNVDVSIKVSRVSRLVKSTQNAAHVPQLSFSLLLSILYIELKYAWLLIRLELGLNQISCSLIQKRLERCSLTACIWHALSPYPS